jgi:putative endonuclease
MKSYAYILECSDLTFYTGATSTLDKRINKHHIGYYKDCYTFDKRPVKLVFVREFEFIEEAIAFEKRVKRWSAPKKRALIAGNIKELKRLSECKNKTHHKRSKERSSEDETDTKSES